ncbi:MAG: hypothetical protein NC452_13715 [Eubacterium sp.]|nr:hypothetical protein [Eubacterium sp.]
MNDNSSSTGCGLLLIDLLAITAFVTLMAHKGIGLHIVFSILIGVAVTVLFVVLTRIPYLGRLLQAALGLIWGLIIYFALDNIFHYSKDVGLMSGLRENDPIMWWAVVIVVDIICVLLHIGIFSMHFGTMNFQHRRPRQTNSRNEDDEVTQIFINSSNDDT